MKKLFAVILALTIALSLAAACADGITIAVPNDPTNEGRALLLLESYGVIQVDDGAGILATVADITDNPLGIQFNEVEAANVPNQIADVDYAIINGNYALAYQETGNLLNALLYENADSPYVNVVSVKEENKDVPEAKALAAAIQSQQIVDFFAGYQAPEGQVQPVCVIEKPTDGYDPELDYADLAGKTIKVGCSLDPHSYVLEEVKKILAAKDIKLEITVLDDYVTPNVMVNDGDLFANYFAHQPYQDSFNKDNGTNLITIAGIHVEPMGLYGGKQADLSALGIKK